MADVAKELRERSLPAQGWAGLALVALFWPLNWLLPGMRTHVLFFPLWLGFVLAIDGIVLGRTGTSILSRSPRVFALLFLVSIPVWWSFEAFNQRLQNWEYIGRGRFGALEYAFWSSLSFSTVVPAVLESAELFRSFAWMERFARGPRLAPSRRLLAALFLTGLAMVAAMLAWPRAFYPCLWISGVFLLEPVARLLGRRSLLTFLERGDWRPWMSLWSGALLCGLCWEAWNFYSFPKWIYHVPGVGFGKVFEMPILGYLGYLPFSLEVYLLAQILLPDERKVRL